MKTYTRWLITFGVALLVIGLSACGGEPQAFVEVRDPWIRAAVATGSGTSDSMGEDSGTMDESMASGGTSAAYMILINNSDEADRLISATTDVAETVELHISEMADDGVMSMRPVENIEIPANSQVELQPGGLHIMLIGLTQNLNDGDTVNLTLNMENMGIIDLAVPVRQP